jgi:rubrerythrin
MASAYRVFKSAEQLETLAGDLYRLLALRFVDDEMACDLFRRLAEEEDQHALRIRLLFAQYRNDPRLFEGPPGAAAPDVEALVQEMAAVLAGLEAGEWGRDLDDVQRLVGLLEDRCAEVHAHLLARGAHPEVRRFFEELARQDREHQRLLAALANRAA